MRGSRPVMTSARASPDCGRSKNADNGSFEAYRRLDLYYVENWSLLLDLTILLHTVPAVIGRGWRALRPADRSAGHDIGGHAGCGSRSNRSTSRPS